MSSELQRFAFPDTGQQVRTVNFDGEPWFVAADVARILGYRMASDMTRRLDDDEKGTHSARTPGGEQEMAVISEAGLYAAILGSQVAGARAFKRWVTHEVLPAIRRAGSYAVQPQHVIPASFADALELAARQAREIEAQAVQIAELEPDAARAEQLAETEGLALVGTVAKRFGLRPGKLREFLYDQRVLIRDGSRRNEPMANYMDAGYFKVDVREVGEPPRSASTTKVTPKGELFIWRRLFKAGMVGQPEPPQRQMALLDVEYDR